MKYIDVPALSRLNAFLDNVDVGTHQVHGDIEVYSCKLVGIDRKLCQSLEQEVQGQKLSGSSPELTGSPVGPLTEASSRKTLVYLILTLNHTYPDYDFSQLRAQHFEKEGGIPAVEEAVDSWLLEVWESLPGNGGHSFMETVWKAIDEAVTLKNCDVYRYKSDGEADPLSERGAIWSFNYFFHNKAIKRILYFSCHGYSKAAGDSLNTSLNNTSANDKSDGEEAENVLRYGMANSMDL